MTKGRKKARYPIWIFTKNKKAQIIFIVSGDTQVVLESKSVHNEVDI